MSCNHSAPSFKKIRLSSSEQALIRPAITVLQLGAGMYFGEVFKQFMLPIMMMSLSLIAFVTVNAWKKSPGETSN